jgi:hypothetical protein
MNGLDKALGAAGRRKEAIVSVFLQKFSHFALDVINLGSVFFGSDDATEAPH